MASKYDLYWQDRLDAILELFTDARASKQSEPLDVFDLDTLSERQNWHGTLEIVDGQPVRGTNSPLRSLGTLLSDRLPTWATRLAWRLVLSQERQLAVAQVEQQELGRFGTAEQIKASINISQRLEQWKQEATDPQHPNHRHVDLNTPARKHTAISELLSGLRTSPERFGPQEALALFGTLNSGQRMKNKVVDENPLPQLREQLLAMLYGDGAPADRIAAASSAIRFAGLRMLGELYGWAHVDTAPLYNDCATEALAYLGYEFDRRNYAAFVAAHEQFKQIYQQQVGHLRPDLLLNLEIDKLYNVIDKVDLKQLPLPLRETDAPRQRFWKIAPGDNAWNWNACREGGFIAVGWDELGDISGMSRNEFDARQAELVARLDGWTKIGSNQVWTFAHIQEGDRIVANRGTTEILGIGTVTGPYYFVPNIRHGHRLQVHWDDVIPRQVNELGWRRTLIELEKTRFEELTQDLAPYDRQTFLARTYLYPQQAEDLYELLLDKRQIIFYGPPGTGKTFVAQELAKWITGLADPPADRVEMIQFHPAYSYEDFIEGIRPESRSTDDGHFVVDYPPRPGVFRRFCSTAQSNPDQNYAFVIDEINRGNIPRIFGELMLLLEYRDRDVPLPYSGKRFRIPPNVYLIGTMNTADRSIALVDFALRRRFHFFHFGADSDLLERWLADHPPQIPYLAELYRRLSEEAIDDPNYAVGPSYFMDSDLTERKLKRIWRHSIEPYLEEYFVEQQARLNRWRWDSEFLKGIRGEL